MITQSEDTLRTKLDASRKDLLDLGMRNALLNFRPSKARGVEVVDELSAEVFRVLLQNGKSMTFVPAREEGAAWDAPGADSPSEGPNQPTGASGTGPAALTQQTLLAQPGDEDNGKPAARHRDTKLQTSHVPLQLQARLLNTYHTARTHIEEQGANVLFLALGMLTWYEAEQSNEPRCAPLVLLPVRLERSDALDKFHTIPLRVTNLLGLTPGDFVCLAIEDLKSKKSLFDDPKPVQMKSGTEIYGLDGHPNIQ